jgi:hypothetical protein
MAIKAGARKAAPAPDSRHHYTALSQSACKLAHRLGGLDVAPGYATKSCGTLVKRRRND